MKRRIYKKLCKKAAFILGMKNCDVDDGIYYFGWYDSYLGDGDSEPAWDWLKHLFDANVNTNFNEGEPEWKPKEKCLPLTPRNVFAWAKTKQF